MSNISLRIRRIRTQAAMTQSELARRLGIQRSAVTQWEQDQGTTPSVSHLVQIAHETNACFEWLATGRGPSHLEEDARVDAAMLQDFARDHLESRVLLALRRVNKRKREAAVQMVELFSA